MSPAQSSTMPSSTFTDSAKANSAAPVVSAPPPTSRRIQSTVIANLRDVFQQLAEKNPRPAAYLHAAMRAIVSHHRMLGFSLTGRISAETLGDFACVGSLTADEQLQLRNLVSQAALAGHSELNTRISGPYTLDGKASLFGHTANAQRVCATNWLHRFVLRSAQKMTKTFNFARMNCNRP